LITEDKHRVSLMYIKVIRVKVKVTGANGIYTNVTNYTRLCRTESCVERELYTLSPSGEWD